MSLLEQIQLELQKLLPKAVPGVAKGVVVATGSGWFRALYYDPLTGAQVTFLAPPTIVAIAEMRGGTPPTVTAPTITIPTVELPTAPTISIPTITLPSATAIAVPAVALPKTPTIEIPLPSIDISPLSNLIGYRFDIFFPWPLTAKGDELEATLNKMMELWDSALYKLIAAVNAVNDGFKKARDAVIAVRDSLFDFRDKVQTAINEYKDKIQTAVNNGLSDARTKTQEALNAYRDKIQTSVNSGLADSRNKTQAALNTYRDNIQASVNAGLGAVIPKLYEMVGMPIGQLMSPINIRNVQVDSFEFYSLSAGMKLHYICIGKR